MIRLYANIVNQIHLSLLITLVIDVLTMVIFAFQLTVVEETIKYIEELHVALAKRLKDNGKWYLNLLDNTLMCSYFRFFPDRFGSFDKMKNVNLSILHYSSHLLALIIINTICSQTFERLRLNVLHFKGLLKTRQSYIRYRPCMIP